MTRAVLLGIAALVALSVGAAGCGSSNGDDEPVAVDLPAGFFGVVPQTGIGDEDLDRMEQGNVGTIRLVVPWGAIETTPQPDDANLQYVDTVVLGAAARGIQVLPTIYATPVWVAEGLDGAKCDPNCGPWAPRSDEAIAAWKDFIGRTVDRYGIHGSLWAEHPEVPPLPIRSWQIWNEQNSPTFYQPKVDPASYEKVLSAAAETIRDRDPDAEVILGGMFGTPYGGKPPGQTAWSFLRELYEIDGDGSSFDSIAAHPYAAHEEKIELQVRRLREVADDAGDQDAGLWITEVGASSDEGDNPLLRGLDGQADQLREAFDFFLAQQKAWDIRGVTWYSWRDISDPNQCDWCPGSGLFEEAELTPKPSWDAFVSYTGGS